METLVDTREAINQMEEILRQSKYKLAEKERQEKIKEKESFIKETKIDVD
jgi:hypothetical protein